MAASIIKFPHTSATATERWDASVPETLIPALTHLRESYSNSLGNFAVVSRLFCHAILNQKTTGDPDGFYLKQFESMKANLIGEILEEFNRNLGTKTEASVFKAFFDLLIENALAKIMKTLENLVEIAKTHRSSLPSSQQWVASQLSFLVRSKTDLIRRWVKDACDVQPFEQNDRDERLHWRKWRSPRFLTMRPLGNAPWVAGTAWDRADEKTTDDALSYFQTMYILRLEQTIRLFLGEMAVRDAQKGVLHDAAASLPIDTDKRKDPKKRQRLLNPAEKRRLGIIAGAIQANLTGLDYCRELDRRQLQVPVAWISEGCSPTYVAAYKLDGSWRKRIQDQKNRYRAKSDALAPARREKLIQQALARSPLVTDE